MKRNRARSPAVNWITLSFRCRVSFKIFLIFFYYFSKYHEDEFSIIFFVSCFLSLSLTHCQSFFSFSFLLLPTVQLGACQKYYGTHINRLSELHHGVSGDVFAVDSRTLFIKDFTYDGEGPAAYFYVGTSRAPNAQGAIRIRDERGSNGVLKRYRKKDITLTLPEGKTLCDIKWFSVWCDEFSVDFGSVIIPKT